MCPSGISIPVCTTFCQSCTTLLVCLAQLSRCAAGQSCTQDFHAQSLIFNSSNFHDFWQTTTTQQPCMLCNLVSKACVQVQSLHHGRFAVQASDASVQQAAVDLPELQPGDLHVCIRWLEDRRALLEAEQTAIHALPPVTNQTQRLEVTIYCTLGHFHAHFQFC